MERPRGVVLQRRHHEPQPLEIVSRRISTSTCRRTSDNRPLGTRCQRSAQQHSSKDRENGKPPSHCEDETAKGSNNVVSIPLGNELSAHIDSPGPRKTTQELSFPTRTPENDTMGKGKKIPTKALKDHCGIEKARFRSVMSLNNAPWGRFIHQGKSKVWLEAKGLEAVTGEIMVQVCSYIRPKDIFRLSEACPAAFGDPVWWQVQLTHYGPPRRSSPKTLPLARASRLQIQSNYPIYHSRLIAIQLRHLDICTRLHLGGGDCPRLTFAAETLRREAKSLRGAEAMNRLNRADDRKKQYATRKSALRESVIAKRAIDEEHQALVKIRAAVERHAYPPGQRPKHVEASPPWLEQGKRGGKARSETPFPRPSLPKGLTVDDDVVYF